MNCACYNLFNTIQIQLGNLLSAFINNGLNSSSPSTDDGHYQPNFHLLDGNSNTTFDANKFFYLCIILLAFVLLSSMMGARRGRIGGNRSTLK